MTVSEYTFLLNKPNAINEKQTLLLEKVIENFPYFQSARAMHLKGLYNQDSYKYNFALKKTAAHTSDRSVLFDFITSDEFTIIEKDIYEKKLAELLNIPVIESVWLREETNKNEFKTINETQDINNISQPNLESFETQDSQDNFLIETQIQSEKEEITISSVEEKLELGKPLPFSSKEKHSFQEWLQLTQFKKIDRDQKVNFSLENDLNNNEQEKETLTKKNPIEEKISIIDKFIASNPKITPQKETDSKPLISIENQETRSLMTETLARVYLEQKKYQKAIQAYEILILKYPEKSVFFAGRIEDIKKLEQNNS